MSWQEFFKDKKITVMGLGLLGRGVGDIAFLAKYAEEIIVTDLKSKNDLAASLKNLKKFRNIKYRLSEHNLKDFEDRDFVLKAAGVPLGSQFIAHAKRNKIPVYMSTALFAKFTPAKVVGITGTRGKTSVTYMIYEALKKYYKNGRVFLGGNIKGMSTLALLPKTRRGDIAVLELDSWQLQGFGNLKISPQLAIFTTFMPDHLDYYGGKLKKYFSDKVLIFSHQNKRDIFILSSQAKKSVSRFNKNIKGIVVGTQRKFSLCVPGEHNQLNASLAFVALSELGIKNTDILKSLKSFRGVPGRLEYLKTIKTIKIYNDTTATTPHAAAAALKALGKDKNISLVLGGYDKHIDLKVLGPVIQKHCAWISLLNGSGTDRMMKEKIFSGISHKNFNNIKEATREAFLHTPKNGVLLLSPAFASFGMFKNEYDRGEQFEKIVKNLT